MFSLCCVVCVVAQLANSDVHAAAMIMKEIRFSGFISRNLIVANTFLMAAQKVMPATICGP